MTRPGHHEESPEESPEEPPGEPATTVRGRTAGDQPAASASVTTWSPTTGSGNASVADEPDPGLAAPAQSSGHNPAGAGRRSRRMGRPALTSTAAILRAAREIGFEGLSIRAVTRRIGRQYSTFYRHFPNFAALRAALVDDVLGPLDPTTPDASGPETGRVEGRGGGSGWREEVAEVCIALARILNRYPGLATTLLTTPAPERLLDVRDRLAGRLMQAGFDPAAAHEIVSTALLHTLTAATGTTRIPGTTGTVASDITTGQLLSSGPGLPEIVLDALGQYLCTGPDRPGSRPGQWAGGSR